MIDHRELLINYMLLVISREGVTFVEDVEWITVPSPANLSKEECSELHACQDEAWRRWNVENE